MRWYYACKVHECAVFFKGIYTSGNSRTTGLVRPNIQKKIADICVHEMILDVKYTKIVYFQRNLYSRELTHGRTGSPNIQKKIQIYAYMRWYYACKVHECAVFFKGIYTPGNSRTTGLVRPNIQKKIRDIWVHEMILDVKYTKIVYFQRNLYSRELTHGRTGSPEHPKENNRYMRIWDDIMHVKYTNVLYFSKESILQGTHARLDWFARTSKRK